jgi:thioredoxin reductase
MRALITARRTSNMHDVIIIGGSYAGISAGLQVARARRKVLVVDAGSRRNRFASSSHGFLGQDGKDPAAIASAGRAELLAYPTVTWLEGTAVAAGVKGDGFSVELASGDHVASKRLILAAGVTDELPAIPGVAERWGKHVFHCPYCHGYELDGGRVGVIATSPLSFHQAVMLTDWGPTTYFTRGLFEPTEEEVVALARRGVEVERGALRAVTGSADVQLEDGRTLSFAGLFLASTIKITTPLVAQLGLELEDGMMGKYIKTDASKETTVRGVFACGDIAQPAGSVAFAVGDGALAGVRTHQSLLFR